MRSDAGRAAIGPGKESNAIVWYFRFALTPTNHCVYRLITGKKEYRSSMHALTSIIKNEGVMGVYNGLSAGLLRQATYTTTRLGIYTWMFEAFTK